MSEVNTLTLTPTAGNAYALTGVGSVVIKAGHDLWIGIADAGDALEVAVYADDGEPHYGLISVSYDQEKPQAPICVVENCGHPAQAGSRSCRAHTALAQH